MRRLRAALVITIAVALTFVLAEAIPAPAEGSRARVHDNIAYDATQELRGMKAPRQTAAVDAEAGVSAVETPTLPDHGMADIKLTLYDMSTDPAHAGPYDVWFWKEVSGAHSDVYVAWNDLAAPADSVQQYQTITDADVQYMANEFDARIWESDVFHFGDYEARPDTPEGERAAIMIYNIRDDAYWSSYRFYIAGFFWGSLNEALQMNAVFIDSYDWPNRTRGDTPRPYLYEGTIAHEFEHLIHHDVDADEDSFIDEGLADLAEQFLYGTVTTGGHIGDYVFFHRDSLIDWDGELYDYGNSVLWQDYLWEWAGRMAGESEVLGAPLSERVASAGATFTDSPDKFLFEGDKFTWNLIHDQANGLSSVANHVGGAAEVERLHRDWTLANLLDGQVAEPEWNYANLALGGMDSDHYTIDDGIAYYQSNVNGNMPPTRFRVRRRAVTEPWGAYYRTFGGPQPGLTVDFNGEQSSGVLPHSLPYSWHSGLGNMLQKENSRVLYRAIADVPADSTLEFWTWYDIETDWDYGYVEASTDGVVWEPLTQLTTLPASADTNINGSSAFDYAGGLTGSTGDWRLARYSLAGYDGTVHLRFRYSTDEAVNGLGWYVDDIMIGSAFDDPVATTNGWSTNGWIFTVGLQQNDWSADVYVPWAKALSTGYDVMPFLPVSTPSGTSGSIWVSTQYMKSGKAYAIVSNRPAGTFDAVGRLTILKSR